MKESFQVYTLYPNQGGQSDRKYINFLQLVNAKMDLLPDHILLTYLDVRFNYGYFYTYSLQFCQWHKLSTEVSIFSTL